MSLLFCAELSCIRMRKPEVSGLYKSCNSFVAVLIKPNGFYQCEAPVQTAVTTQVTAFTCISTNILYSCYTAWLNK